MNFAKNIINIICSYLIESYELYWNGGQEINSILEYLREV